MVGKIVKVALAAALVLTVAGAAAPAGAKAGDVVRTGSCSGTSTWKLKLSPDSTGIQVEFEVDSNVVGQTWGVKILENGTRIFKGTRDTVGPSGSFTVNVLGTDTAGTDSFKGKATNAATGELCVGKAKI